MGTTFVFKQQQPLVLVLAMALTLALCVETKNTLTFDNKLPYGLILYHPPGCCSMFSGFHPPPPGYGCGRCPDVWLATNVTTTMDPIVGPYPLQFLQIIAPHGKTYCLMGRNLTVADTLTIGPKECDRGQGIEAHNLAPEKSTDFAVTFCMGLCIG